MLGLRNESRDLVGITLGLKIPSGGVQGSLGSGFTM